MANVLSQSEIDALLNSLNMGDMEDGASKKTEGELDVRPYDFRTANKFSKDQIRTLRTIFDNYTTVLSTRLTGLLRTMCQVSVASVEERLFGEFNNSIPEPTMIAVVAVTAHLHAGWWSAIGYGAAALIAVVGFALVFRDLS